MSETTSAKRKKNLYIVVAVIWVLVILLELASLVAEILQGESIWMTVIQVILSIIAGVTLTSIVRDAS